MAFSHYSAFTVQSGQVPSTQTDFPVLLKPTDNRFRTAGNGGNVQNSFGYDLRPYADSSHVSALDYELVPGTYDGLNGTFEMWVNVPSLAVGSVIYLFYGDSALTTDGSSTNTWESNFKGVFHFPDGASLSVANSSQTSMSPSNSGVVAGSGQIDGAAVSNSTDYVALGTVAALNFSGDFTLSAWVKTTSTGAEILIGGYSNDSPYPGYGLAIGVGVAGKPSLWVGDGSWHLANSTINSGSWVHVAVTYTPNVARWYNNSATDGTPTTGAPSMNYSGDRFLFAGSNLGDNWQGSADEIRIATTVRSADYLTTEYNNQVAPGTFYAIDSEQPLVSGGTTFLGPTRSTLIWR